ncbi:Permease of the drug/metabolite transporter (DMT) superfamily [Caldanaerobius fijiensis DSM 17918]|uniref:Permease of the drug/metabolite transporter (DMT) superfamily n=2 Tax=Caldanaerobius TaxID=862261 RepID=A0A1M4ZGH7_9THEO|nr:Permease of the drug/metabolite transporter (DMT) superfamily [Caldanaerobius fijiensis DSM 17918]
MLLYTISENTKQTYRKGLTMNKGFIYLTITLIFFSSYEVVGRMLTNLVNPYQLNFIRFLIGGLLLLPLAVYHIKNKKIKLAIKDMLYISLIGLVNVVLSMSFFQIGINATKASLAAVIFSSNPLFVIISAHFILKENLNLEKILGLIIGIAGLVIVFYKDLNISKSYTYGIIMLILAAITYGIYTTMGKKFSQKTDSVIMNSLSFIIGSLLLLPILLIKHYPIFYVPYKALLPMAYLTFFVTGIAYYTYFVGLMYMDAGVGSMIFLIKPILASLLAWMLLSEKISMQFAIGTLVILAGIAIVQHTDKKTVQEDY